MTLSVALRHSLSRFDIDVEFQAPPGVTALFGRSGSGKTTIINAVAGLLRPEYGKVTSGDMVLVDTEKGIWRPPHFRRLGYIFQEGRLFPHLTVRQNLLYGRWFAPRGETGESIDRVVELLGIGHLLDRQPPTLSGGEKQRVAIGRALLATPQLILADEPLASLDAERKAEILPYFERIRDEARIPFLYVTHSVTELARLATSVIAIENGRVVRSGSIRDILSDPEAAPILGVREAGSVLHGRVTRHHADGLTEIAAAGGQLFLPKIDIAPGSNIRVRVNAQDVILSREAPVGLSALNLLEGTVERIRPGSGPGTIVQLRVSGDSLLARITKRSADAMGLEPGTPCHAIVKAVSVAPIEIGSEPDGW